MNLIRKYLKDTGLTQAQFAEKAKVPQGLVSQWVNDKLRVSAERVLDVESATEGRLSRHDLRPDIYPRDNAAA